MIFPYIDNNYFLPFPFIPANCEKPPTVYSILESIVNYGKDDKTKIKNLAKEGRTTIFDFEYPLTENISKEDFESMILNHFLMRRIGFETVTAFKIQLNVKLNEIMPIYNKMFDAIENWNIFSDGELTIKSGTDNRTVDNTTNTKNTTNSNNIVENESSTTNNLENSSTTTNTETRDKRNSELPQNQLNLLRDGSYVSNYDYEQNDSSSEDNSQSNGNSQSSETSKSNFESNNNINVVGNTKDNNVYQEKIERSPADKIAIYKEFQENLKSIYGMIFKDLECLFYQLI